jgi:alpha-glucoside transport system permease protein
VSTSILIAPVALPLVVTGVAFRLLYDPNPARGSATRLATVLPGEVPAWLGPRWITLALMSAFAWVWIGLAFVVFRAALDRLPRELADTVRAYGGTPWEAVRDGLWLPQVRRIVAIVLALVALSTVRTFDLILTMAPGSVLDDASVLAVMQWQTSGATTSGPAAALGVLWLAAVAAGVLLVAWWSRPARRTRPRRTGDPGTVPAGLAAPPGHGQKRQGGGAQLGGSRAADVVVDGALVLWIVPLLVLVATSLHAPREAATKGWWAPPFGLGSYSRLEATGIVASLQLTALLAVVVTVAVLVVAVLAVRALTEMPPAGAQAAIVVLLAAAVVPVQVVAGPITEVLAWARLTGQTNPLRLVLVHVALAVPLAVVVLWSARARLSFARVKETWQAGPARGRSLRERVRSTLDAEPAVVAVCVLVFVQVWNDFVVGLMFGGPHAVPFGLWHYGESRQFVANMGVLAAGSVIASIVPLVIVVLNHRRVVAGLIGHSHEDGPPPRPDESP